MQRTREFLRFCVVGGTGFVVDAGILEMFCHYGVSAPIARAVSIAVALQVTFLLHGFYTFKTRGGFSRQRWLQFMLFNLVGAALNYGTFLLVLMLPLLEEPLPHRYLALVMGTAVGLVFNYTSNRRFVFTEKR